MQRDIHLLFADDNPGDRELAREALEHCAERVHLHTACDGAEALDFLRQFNKYKSAPRPDVVLLDINMPRMDGLETLKIIKNDIDLMTIPVVVFSSSTAPTDLQLAYALHANAYVIKPSGLGDFLRAVQEIEKFWGEVATSSHYKQGGQHERKTVSSIAG